MTQLFNHCFLCAGLCARGLLCRLRYTTQNRLLRIVRERAGLSLMVRGVRRRLQENFRVPLSAHIESNIIDGSFRRVDSERPDDGRRMHHTTHGEYYDDEEIDDTCRDHVPLRWDVESGDCARADR